MVAGLSRGEPDALAALYDRHGRLVYSLALRIVGDGADAEEIAQDVFAQAWRQAARYDRQRGSVAAWLATMTRSRGIDRLRRRQARPQLADEPVDPESFAGRGEDAEAQLVSKDDAARLRTAMTGLPVAQRIAIELAFFEGLSYVEVAEKLDAPVGTVKTRIRQGLLKLRQGLQEAWP